MSHSTIIIHSSSTEQSTQRNAVLPEEPSPLYSTSITFTPHHGMSPQEIGDEVARIHRILRWLESPSSGQRSPIEPAQTDQPHGD